MEKKGLEERFWSKVDIKEKDDCWNWMACSRGNGYGCIRVDDKIVDSHRIAWILTNGEIINSLWVLHSCDNKLCCNPNHLFLGTQLDNNRDMFKKGRAVIALKLHPELAARGEKASSAKLKEFQVIEIRKKLNSGCTLVELSKEYFVDERNIARIRDRRTWKEI